MVAKTHETASKGFQHGADNYGKKIWQVPEQ
jgi:hypothetical protein